MFCQISFPVFILLLWFPISSSPACFVPFISSNIATYFSSEWGFKEQRKLKTYLVSLSLSSKIPGICKELARGTFNSAPLSQSTAVMIIVDNL